MIAVLSIGLILIIFARAFFVNKSSLLYPTFWRGSRKDRRIALSFDDGPSPVCTPELLRILEEHDVKASFFLVGRQVQKYPEIVKQIHEAGHMAGNHDYEHSLRSFFRSPASAESEMLKSGESISSVCGFFPAFYRAPVGIKTPPRIIVAWRLGLNFVGWSMRAVDGGRGVLSRNMTLKMISKARGGELILLHDNSLGLDGYELDNRARLEGLRKNLPFLIKGLKDKGFEFSRVDEISGLSCELAPEKLKNPENRKMKFTELCAAFCRCLIHEEGSPLMISFSFAAGAFLSCTPFYGIQALLGLMLAGKFKLHKLAVVIGTNVANPLTAPFLIFFCIWLGAYISGHGAEEFTWANFQATGFKELLDRGIAFWFTGFVPGGLITAAVCGLTLYLVLFIFKNFRAGESS